MEGIKIGEKKSKTGWCSPHTMRSVQQTIEAIEREQIERASRVQDCPKRRPWKEYILPEVQEEYERVMRSRISTPKKGFHTSETLTFVSSNKSEQHNLVEKPYGERTSNSLKQENKNLKEELFYLRKALLLNFITKQQAQNSQASSRKVPQ